MKNKKIEKQIVELQEIAFWFEDLNKGYDDSYGKSSVLSEFVKQIDKTCNLLRDLKDNF